jgi:hypothetical protein
MICGKNGGISRAELTALGAEKWPDFEESSEKVIGGLLERGILTELPSGKLVSRI